MPSRRLLLVVYPYPPMPNVGANRWLAAGKYLERLGHKVTVVTTSAFGRLPDDETRRVVRTGDLNAAPALRNLLRRPPLAALSDGQSAVDKPPPTLLTRTIVPDPYVVSWTPMALRAARRIIRLYPVDCIVTSGPHESTHLVALGLGRHRPAWVADFRDGWTFEPLRPPFPTSAQRALDRRLERAVVRSADAVVGATPPIADDLSRRFRVETAYIPNGWDPDLEPGDVEPTVELDSDRITLVHTGSMSTRADPRPLFEALGRLARTDPQAADRLELVLAGRLSPSDASLVQRAPAGVRVRHVGMLPREQALLLQRRAAALLLLTSRHSSEATGKLFEYLAAGRPILALADGNVAARIVRETGTGLTVAPDDVDGIATALGNVATGELDRSYRARGLERYRYPELAELFAEQIERAIARRRV
jgi:glycosyltransferase involved in cell wall biosynthesis